MPENASLWYFISHADIAVQLVIITLILASILSWTLIFQRTSLYKKTQQQAKAFESTFWSGVNLDELYQQSSKHHKDLTGLGAIFYAGYSEYRRLDQYGNTHPDALLDGADRAMRLAIADEMDELEHHLPFLATVGSTSPYIGLFGTVWGIMTSFHALGQVQQASIAMVAPGISEALIATAIGLFAAIPAVMAYNKFSHQLERIDRQYMTFHEELLRLLHRQAHQPIT